MESVLNKIASQLAGVEVGQEYKRTGWWGLGTAKVTDIRPDGMIVLRGKQYDEVIGRMAHKDQVVTLAEICGPDFHLV